jgi:predicted enzyme related to lactoylglutathione lyase
VGLPDVDERTRVRRRAGPDARDAVGLHSTLVYFSCEDCATEGGRVNGAGGKVQREKMSIGEYGHIVLAHDTEGTCSGCTR